MFTLEALRARHGDALLLHFGEQEAPRLMVVDGGPSGVWRRALRPRLAELRQRRDLDPDEALDIDLVMVSHMDDDHIRGILDLAGELVERQEDGRPLPYRVRSLWHNSFDDIVGRGADALLGAGLTEVGVASATDLLAAPDVPGLSRDAALMLASVPQGRTLRDQAAALGLDVNPPAGGGPIVAEEHGTDAIDLGEGLELVVVGPPRNRVEALQRRWERELERLGLGQPASVQAAALLDQSVFNLASLVVLMRRGGRSMLLTGDARADDVMTGLHGAGLLDGGRLHVDLLKVPHHGSDRNVDTDFFRAVTADHYVLSGDGRHGNPEPATFEMIFVARGDDPFTLHLTHAPGDLRPGYPVAELESLFDRQRAQGARFTVNTPAAGEQSLSVEL